MKNKPFYLLAFLFLIALSCKKQDASAQDYAVESVDIAVTTDAISEENISDPNTESYTGLEENPFESPKKSALSIFSIDVDNASH